MSNERKEKLHFFIDYHDADLSWVEWITWQLENVQYTVKYRQRDFQSGSNIVLQTDQALRDAEQVIIILSREYLKDNQKGKGGLNGSIWSSAFWKDPKSQKEKLVLLRVRACRPDGLLGPLIPLDLLNCSEHDARTALLNGIARGHTKEKPQFPGGSGPAREASSKPDFHPFSPRIWHAPPHNPFFTDRDYNLTDIYESLSKASADQIHTYVINGLGGMGKTQVALAYAHNYKHLYKIVLWADATTRSTLASSIIGFADILPLHLSRADRQNEQRIITAMKLWLEGHANWLLILDNAENLETMRHIMPTTGNGHVLLTARMQATGSDIAFTRPLHELPPEDAALFLLRRIKMLEIYHTFDQAPKEVQTLALQVSSELGNFSLMLDQAGAYMEEADRDMSGYLQLYSDERLRPALLRKRGKMPNTHQESVAETWNRAFEIVRYTSPAAYDLLCFCAFLHCQNIPEEILTRGTATLLPSLQRLAHNPLEGDEAIAVLNTHSLLSRDGKMQTLSMNRIVQIVLKDKMSEEERLYWAKQAIQAVHATLEAIDEKASAPLHCLRYHQHVKICAYYIQHWQVTSPEAARMLHRMGKYLYDYFSYTSHNPSLSVPSLTYTYIVSLLDNFALLLRNMGQTAEVDELTTYANSIRAAIRLQSSEG